MGGGDGSASVYQRGLPTLAVWRAIMRLACGITFVSKERQRKKERKRIGSSNFRIIGLSKPGLGGPIPSMNRSKRTSSG